MEMKKYNQILIKNNNKKQVYQLIEDIPGISRTQIADQMKVSKTTVSALVDELMQEGYVVDEGASVSNRQGRKPNSLTVNSRDNVVIVLNWHKDSLEIGLVDSAMNITMCREYDMRNKADALAELGACFESFQESQCVGVKVMGVCVIVPGMIDERHDKIISVVLPAGEQGSYRISRLREMIKGYPLAILNDTACFAYAENAFGNLESKNYIYININDGVGAALLHGGVLLGGASGMSTQFGHVSVDRNGYPCMCGNRGCLENQIGELALPRLFEEFGLENRKIAGEKLLFKDLVALVKAGDAKAEALMAAMAEDLAYALCNAASLFHPEAVIIGGIGRKLGDTFLAMLKEKMGQMGFRQFVSDVDTEYTTLGEASVVRGAAKYYINQYFRFNDMDGSQLFCG
ncbi:ROK family transcriptional regulator [Lacrimispora sp. 210928-DFI.3.58]|uniref:ROK family transcriptional regulator n=1 Tax=Lacrimispora sp. 210928-DFI.3.58 TaxID=2883214 RepID=UPI0015B43B6A|nr:ROK family transcriptional regulator [Lacrimispora sp. 210928-DFI.3.58]MCB7319205.1 ROK family protein [Lacrimispora sp. 210928-DFI.3.58]